MTKIRLALMQKKLGLPITHSDALILKKFKPHFICFPEYFFLNKKMEHFKQTPHNYMRERKRIQILSSILKCVVIGGTMLEPENGRVYNTCFVYRNGKLQGSYRKQNLFKREIGNITPGRGYKVFSAFGLKFGVLICADVLSEPNFFEMEKLGPRIIFIPTFSPKRVETMEEKFKRDNDIFVKAAQISNSVIVKVCGVKSEFRDSIQARSLIADKNGIIIRAMPDEEEKEMIILKEIEI